MVGFGCKQNADTTYHRRWIKRRFVVEVLSRKLRLPVDDDPELILNTFGQSAFKQSEKYKVVLITLQSQFSSTKCVIDAVEYSTICEEIEFNVARAPFVTKFANTGKTVEEI